MKPRSTTSEEPAISVKAAAISPPVQDSAVARCQPRPRQPSSTVAARARMSRSNTRRSLDRQQDQDSVDRRQQIVEHDAEAAADPPVGPGDRPRLQNVENP